MTHYHSANMKLSKSHLNILKSVAKNATDVALTLSSNMTGTDETNSLLNLLLTDW